MCVCVSVLLVVCVFPTRFSSRSGCDSGDGCCDVLLMIYITFGSRVTAWSPGSWNLRCCCPHQREMCATDTQVLTLASSSVDLPYHVTPALMVSIMDHPLTTLSTHCGCRRSRLRALLRPFLGGGRGCPCGGSPGGPVPWGSLDVWGPGLFHACFMPCGMGLLFPTHTIKHLHGGTLWTQARSHTQVYTQAFTLV